jgi:hypothetical protein
MYTRTATPINISKNRGIITAAATFTPPPPPTEEIIVNEKNSELLVTLLRKVSTGQFSCQWLSRNSAEGLQHMENIL